MKIARLGYWEYDIADDLFTFNDHFYAIFRTSAEQVGGYRMSSARYARLFIHPDDRPVVGLETRKAIESTDPNFSRQIEHRIIYANGEIGYISVRFFIVKDSQGRTIKAYGANQDITERKRAEEALRESESNLQSVFDAVPLGICFMKDRVYKRANKSWCDGFGYPEEHLIGKTPEFLYENKEEYMRVGKELYGQLLKEGIASVNSRLKRSDGEFRDVILTAKPLDSQYIEAGTVVVIHDITHQKRAEEEKERLEDRLRQAQKMESIGTLAGGIAHDFNNILGIILGNTELAIDDVPEWNPARNNLDKVRKACLRAKDVVRQILAFSRKSETEQKTISMGPLVTESLNLLRASIPTTIDIRRKIADDLHRILGDPTQIHQIMINLCTNAAHAMENKGGTLEVALKNRIIDADTASRYADLRPGSYVQIRVSDTGDGINPDVIDRIFDPYFTTKDVGKGTGLGLSVVHGIVKSHNGSIVLKSKAGKGTTFNIFLPAVLNQRPKEPKDLRMLPTGQERILLVDDEEFMVDLNQQRLERLGYTVTPETDPSEALRLFRSDPDQFDLVITDMTMPKMTGDRLARELLNTRPHMPIILSTGYSDRISEARAQDSASGNTWKSPSKLKTWRGPFGKFLTVRNPRTHSRTAH